MVCAIRYSPQSYIQGVYNKALRSYRILREEEKCNVIIDKYQSHNALILILKFNILHCEHR
jgi:hypothetical protein